MGVKVDWGPIIGTVIGATIGLSSTVVLERSRTSRDLLTDKGRHRRELYGKYLTAHAQTYDALQTAARTPPGEKARSARLSAAFDNTGLYGLRFQLEVSAPKAVSNASVEAFRALREVKDELDERPELQSLDGLSLSHRYNRVLDTLVTTMRDDVGS